MANPKALQVASQCVVACPDEAHGFDGKIDLIQVATENTHKKNICLDNAFLDEIDVNDAVKTHWKNLAFVEMKVGVSLSAVADYYDLDEDVARNMRL